MKKWLPRQVLLALRLHLLLSPKRSPLATYLPTKGAPRSRVTKVEFSSWLPSGVSRGRKPSTLNQIFGRLPTFIGDTGQNTLERDVGNNRKIKN